MSNDNTAKLSLAYKVGFWSAVLTTFLGVTAGITATAAVHPFATIVGFLVAPTFIVMMAWIYSTAPGNCRFVGLIGLVFALIKAR
jgi:uncharacterized Tic20 family protein